ncbi:hypothetical protein [Parabacteroides sp. PF5-9]|uniref:hypothetical protein n=1 Tax=Parabacteroides sp. PF5-9 TaxID=1742404 RepID=UPI0024765CB2|nr:hypothetical protein [Parabacteroides sp. PF5-9]MDH6356250.1 hypothetical protein [Parabacteroides sp. PF5-9]
MKTVFLKFSLAVIMALISLSVYAQGERPQRVTPKEFAEQKAEQLEKELALDEKQRKEVYKIYLTQANKLFPTQSGGGEGGGRGGRGGGGAPGGGMGGEMGGGGGAGAASVNFGPSQRKVTPGETDKDIANREKKMKKLLTEEQYAKWAPIESELNQQNKERLSRQPQGGGAPGGGRPQRN